MTGEKVKSDKPELSEAAAYYAMFLVAELAETVGASSFVIHHAAPEVITTDELEAVAAMLREIGHDATVAEIEYADQVACGVKIVGNSL